MPSPTRFIPAFLTLAVAVSPALPAPAATVPVRTLNGNRFFVSAVAFSPDGRLVASGGYDGSVRIWNRLTGQLQRTLLQQSSLVTSVAFSNDSRWLAGGITSRDSRELRLWNVSTGAVLSALRLTQTVTAVAYAPDGKTLATAGADHEIRLWDIRDAATAGCRLLGTVAGHTSTVWSLGFSRDGRTLVSGSQDKTVRIWQVDTASGQARQLRVLRGHTDTVKSVALAHNSSLLASASYDDTVKLWDPATGALVTTLTGHTDKVAAVAFSPSGRLLATGGTREVRLWRVPSSDPAATKMVQQLNGHTGSVTSLVFSPDGRTLASASWDRTVKLWDVRRVDSRRRRSLLDPALLPASLTHPAL